MGFTIVTIFAQLDTRDMAAIPDFPQTAEFLSAARSATTASCRYHRFYTVPSRTAVYLACDGKLIAYFAVLGVTPEQMDVITAALGESLGPRWSGPEFCAVVEHALGEKSDNVRARFDSPPNARHRSVEDP
jgi:hypothetical protein